jgi:predicted DCC family thiol-disulfide oxidoreductase YuxK
MVHPIILFDGVCNLCNSAVRWVIARDPEERFRFASLQSDAAQAILGDAVRMKVGETRRDPIPDSIVLIDSEGVHTRSAAVLRIAHELGLPYSLLGVTVALPRSLRDRLYDLVARNRYRWFGRREACLRPPAPLAGRFLEGDIDT